VKISKGQSVFFFDCRKLELRSIDCLDLSD